MFGRQPRQAQGQSWTLNEKQLCDLRLLSSYTTLCAKTCIQDFNEGLTQGEKKCLAKCLDRSADYLKLI